MKTLTVQVPDEMWQAFTEIALRDGRTAEAVCMEWLAKHAPRRPNRSPEEIEAAQKRFRSHFGAVSSGNPHASDNEQIDADLAREYENTHEEQA